MRKKAEKQIRKAAFGLGSEDRYRIDMVRQRAGLIRKVYDKTLIDMARVGTIEFVDGNIEDIPGANAGDMIFSQGTWYIYFRFLDLPETERPVEPDTVSITVKGIDRRTWQAFADACDADEHTDPYAKIREMISTYSALKM